MPSNGDSDDERATVGRRSILRSIGGTAAIGAFATGADGEERPAVERNYSFVQGDKCVPVVPLSGDVTVEELYGLEIPERFAGDNGATDSGDGPYYQSNGTADLQRRDTTITFLYDGPEGLSLVTVHDATGSQGGTDGGDEGGAVSWTVENVPSDATWAVKDDLYLDSETGEPADRNFDDWTFEGETHTVDWTWGSAGTDGGALRGVGADFSLTVDPAFNERAALWGEHYAKDPITDWQVLSFPDGRDSPRRTSLALDRRVTVQSVSCGGTSGEEDDRIDVRIDVKPGSDRNPINPRSRGVIPVAIFGGDGFDPSSVDVATLRFGPPRVVDADAGARPAHGGHLGSIDGAVALVVHFRTDEAGFETGDDEAKLVGRTDEGTLLAGADDVTIVGNGRDDDGDEDDSQDDGEAEEGDRNEDRGDDDEREDRDDDDEEEDRDDEDEDDDDEDDEEEDEDDDDEDDDDGRGNRGNGRGNGRGRGEGNGDGNGRGNGRGNGNGR